MEFEVARDPAGFLLRQRRARGKQQSDPADGVDQSFHFDPPL
jgi:hypothetical protein